AGNTNLASDLANIYIAANSGANLPGSTLESFLNVHCTGAFGLNNPIMSFTSSAQPFLQSGSTYWLWVQAALPQAVIIVNQNKIQAVTDYGLKYRLGFDTEGRGGKRICTKSGFT